MTRLTNPQYLQQRNRLKDDWYHQGAWTFSHLESLEEMELHHFFAPTKDFTEEQAIAHRVAVTKQYPSLPHGAGRAFAHALSYLGTAPARDSSPLPIKKQPKARHQPFRGGRIIVKTVQRPEIDIPKLLRILEQIRQADDEDHAA